MQMVSPAAAFPTAFTGVAKGSDMLPGPASLPSAATYSVLATRPVPGTARIPACARVAGVELIFTVEPVPAGPVPGTARIPACAAAQANVINTTASPGITIGRVKSLTFRVQKLPHEHSELASHHAYPGQQGTV